MLLLLFAIAAAAAAASTAAVGGLAGVVELNCRGHSELTQRYFRE